MRQDLRTGSVKGRRSCACTPIWLWIHRNLGEDSTKCRTFIYESRSCTTTDTTYRCRSSCQWPSEDERKERAKVHYPVGELFWDYRLLDSLLLPSLMIPLCDFSYLFFTASLLPVRLHCAFPSTLSLSSSGLTRVCAVCTPERLRYIIL